MSRRDQLLVASAVMLCVAAAAGRASADTIVFQNQAGQSGGTFTVNSNGVTIGDSSGFGSAADGRISGVADTTTANATSVTGVCSGLGCLELQTGSFIGQDPVVANQYDFNGGGYIRIFGNADGASGPPSTSLLLSTSFDLATTVTLTFDSATCPGPTCQAELSGTLATGILNTSLATFFGVPTLTTTGSDDNSTINFVLTTSGVFPFGTGLANINDVTVQTPGTSVPEPTSVVLFDMGLLGIARPVYRRVVSR